MPETSPPGPAQPALLAARLAAIVESSDDAIVSKTLDGTVTSWNAAAERMYGYTAAEMVGRSIYAIIPEALRTEERQILGRVTAGEHVAHYETMRVRRDGAQLCISLTISPLRDSGGTIVGASSIQRDITDRKRAEEALRQAAKMEAIGRLAGGLAHDFNNQLHALSGFANFVARDQGLSAGARQDLVQIQKVTERMASLTRQLLAFARQQVLSPETVDLSAAVLDTEPMLQRLIGSSIEIALALGPGPKWVRVDRAQLVQVLMNLVINARDAMPQGGRLRLRTDTLEVSPGQLLDRLGAPVEPGAYAELSVEDSGEGIPQEYLPRVFEPFFTTKGVGGGTGLGLPTVEGIVSQSGGRIQIESSIGRGTTIRILLPLTSERAPHPLSPSPTRPFRLPRERLLVVDDEDLVRAVLMRTLQAEGYEVVGASDGREAIACLEQAGGAIDLVISDVVMPVLGGCALGQEIERRYPDMPIVWMSGHPREIGASDAGEAERFLQKPIPPEVLLRTVAEVLQGQSGR
ncbi:MAG TPA: PAS domain S-box protein [Gemmatimonadales bacterium]|nr:PAS domain S-box protein [Gemmatimonadales bacterium]